MRVLFMTGEGDQYQAGHTLAVLAKRSIPVPKGGWKIVSVEGIPVRKVEAILHLSESVVKQYKKDNGKYPRNAWEWREIARSAIKAYESMCGNLDPNPVIKKTKAKTLSDLWGRVD